MKHFLYYVKENQTPPTYSSLNVFIFRSLQFSNTEKNHLYFIRGLQSWGLVLTWTVGWCYVYTWTRLLVLIYSFISLIFFLSNFKTLNFCHTFLWGLQSWNLIHTCAMGWSTQAACTYFSLLFFFFVSLQLANIKTYIYKTVSQHTSDGYDRGYVSFAHCLLHFAVNFS